MVVREGFRVFVGDLVTGRITTDLPPSKLGWSMILNDAGSVDVTILPRAAETAKLEVRAATAPLKQFIGCSYNGTILEAGPIWKRAYDPKAETLKITGAGIWTILDVVKALPWAALAAGVSPTQVSLDVVNKTLGSIARELVRISIQTNPSNPGLPIVLPSVVAGSSERHYPGYQLPWLGKLLRDLTGVSRGPDIRFQPRFNGADETKVEWVMTTGTDASPLLVQAGPDWTWDGTAEKSGVVGFGTVEDATGVAAKAYQPGSGSESLMKLKWATDTTLVSRGYPWTETDSASKDIDSEPLLQTYADAAIAQAKYPIETWSVDVRADAEPTLGSYLPGEWAQAIIPEKHPILDPGPVRTRMLSISGDATETVNIALAPIQGRA